jgi:hypothetical protein
MGRYFSTNGTSSSSSPLWLGLEDVSAPDATGALPAAPPLEALLPRPPARLLLLAAADAEDDGAAAVALVAARPSSSSMAEDMVRWVSAAFCVCCPVPRASLRLERIGARGARRAPVHADHLPRPAGVGESFAASLLVVPVASGLPGLQYLAKC